MANGVTHDDLSQLLSSEKRDFLIRNNGDLVPVSDLVGKTILLYFSAHSCPPCRTFLPKLIKAYNDIKATNNALEVVFISSDQDQSAFDEFSSGMPWLALPFGDERKKSLKRKFKVQGIPAVITIIPSSRTLTTTARMLIDAYGMDAYPFTEEHLKHLEEKVRKFRSALWKTTK